MKGKKGSQYALFFWNMGTKCCPNFQKLFLYALLINYYCFAGHSLRSKRCFTKMWGFSSLRPFSTWTSLKKVAWISTGHKIHSRGLHSSVWRTSEKKYKHFFTWLDAGSRLIPLLFNLLEVPPSSVAPPGCRKRARVCECMCVCVRLLNHLCETKINGTHYTRSHFKNTAKAGGGGMDPSELSEVLLSPLKRCS